MCCKPFSNPDLSKELGHKFRPFLLISFDGCLIINVCIYTEKNLLLPRLAKGMLQFSSVAQSCLTLCNPMNHSTPGLPVHHQIPEFTQTHVH